MFVLRNLIGKKHPSSLFPPFQIHLEAVGVLVLFISKSGGGIILEKTKRDDHLYDNRFTIEVSSSLDWKESLCLWMQLGDMLGFSAV